MKFKISFKIFENENVEEMELNGAGGYFSIALELLLSRRDMSNYAFLGIKFTPKNIKSLNIRVNISLDEDEILSDNIAMKSDTVFLGIPNEYAEAIIDTTNKVVREHSLFSCGDLEFFYGSTWRNWIK